MAKRVAQVSPADDSATSDSATSDDAIADDPCDAIDASLSRGKVINDIG
ncbi:MAG: hypothetical protein ACKPBF_11250 [Actinomycetota bacterium]